MSDATDVTQPIDLEIARTYDLLKEYTAESKEYAQVLNQLEKLYQIKSAIPTDIVVDKRNVWEIFEPLAPALSNLLGIAMILQHERVHVVTSKALGFVTKSRI